jgi:hypothetical protein
VKKNYIDSGRVLLFFVGVALLFLLGGVGVLQLRDLHLLLVVVQESPLFSLSILSGCLRAVLQDVFFV